MSTTEIRSASTDNYTVLTEYDASNNLEVAICQTLVQSAYNKVAINPSDGVYTSPANASNWNCRDISDNFINTSAISNYPSGTVTEYSVISSELTKVSSKSYTTNIAGGSCTNNSYNFNSLNTSVSYYDSNYVFTQNLIADCSDNQTGTYVTGTFDVIGDVTDNQKTQYAMQSRWNTIKGPYPNGLSDVGEDPTAIMQDVSFNTSSAFAQYGSGTTDASYVSYWYSCNSADGSLAPTIIDASYQPIQNNFLVGDRDLTGVTLDVANDVGIFRIQQSSNLITTKVSLDGVSNVITTDDLKNMPLFNGYGVVPLVNNSSKNSLPIPGSMTATEFETLLNPNVYNTVADGLTFTIDISSNTGGYVIPVVHPLMSVLDDTDLHDNPYYMENYVSNPHSIKFSNGGITIDVSANGNITDATLITIDLTNGEKLDATYAGVDGEIIINTETLTTRYTDLINVDISGNFAPVICYDVGDFVSPTDALSFDAMTNPYLACMWQKVAQQSSVTSPDYWLKSSNNAIMTLYTDEIIDSLYQANEFEFSFNNALFGSSTDIQLWKITSSNNIIVNPQSLYTDATYTTPVNCFATAGVLTGLVDELLYTNYRIVLTAKTKETLSLQTAVTDASGWEFNYSLVDDSYLRTNSDQAFSQENLASAAFNDGIMGHIQAGNDINYSYTYYTVQQSNYIGGLIDSVDISFNYNGPQVITIPQHEITRVYDASNVAIEIVPDASYIFTGSFYSKPVWQLVYVTATSRYNSTFPAHFGPFSNINLKIKDILQSNNFYAIQNTSNGKFAPYSALQFVTTSIPNYREINETISPSPGNTLTITGVFTKNDLKPFMSITQVTDTNDVWSNIGNSIDTDVYYGLHNTEQITVVSSPATVNTIIEYSRTTTSNTLLTGQIYYIPFVYDKSGISFVLESFNATPANLGSQTDISSPSFVDNTDYLNLSNGYSNAATWTMSQYTLTVIHNITDTVFTAKDTDNNVVFQISTLNNTIFLGTYIVSYIPQDYYRVEQLLGSYTSPVYSENFITTNYGLDRVHLAPLLQGIYIGSEVGILSSTNSPKLGGYQSFRVLGEDMTINEVGSTTFPTSANELGNPTYNNGSLTFQYVSGSNFSAEFTFPKYRGYKSFFTINTNQNYIINRESTSVTFDIDGSGNSSLTDILTSNMYYNETFVVDSLLNNNDNLVAELNLTGSFYYSIAPTGSTLTYPVTVTGDTVNVTINNPNYIGSATNIHVNPNAIHVVDPKSYLNSMTLKDYGTNDTYTFSGQSYLTSDLMAIRPSRVKLNNLAYPYDSFVYSIKLDAEQIQVYKAVSPSDNTFNWIGNPALKGSQNPQVTPLTSDWTLHATYNMSQLIEGIKIGKKVIYQNPDLAIGFKLMYVVSAPPYYKFDQINISNCPVIPYDYSTEYLSNKQVRYMPYIDIITDELRTVFNPFTNTFYTDINSIFTTVPSNSNLLNNVRFTLSSATTITDATTSPNNTRYGIKVPGTNLTVYEYIRLYPSTDSGTHLNPVWVGPVTSIPSTPDINSNALIFRNRDASGGIFFSALQYPAELGYPSGAAGYEQLLRTDVSSNWYNIDFYMGNSSWFNYNAPITYFDVNGNGIKPTLYTVVDINVPLTQINKRRIYKYTTHVTINVDASDNPTIGLQTFNLSFDTRSYKDFDISMNNTFTTNPTSNWLYNNLLDSTVIPNSSPITWTPDTSFTDISIISWSFGNSNTSTQMKTELFSVQNNQNKWVYIHLLPFMRYMNQFNMQVGSVSWDGSVKTPLVNTRVVEIAPSLSDPPLFNNTYAIQQYSESTL